MLALIRSCWGTLLRVTPHLLGAFVLVWAVFVVLVVIAQSRVMGDWGWFGLRDLLTPGEYWEAGAGGTVDLLRTRLWDKARRSGANLGRDAAVIWVLWFSGAALCQAYAVAIVQRRSSGDHRPWRQVLGLALRRFPRLLVAWIVASAIVLGLVVVPVWFVARQSWWLVAPVLLLSGMTVVFLLSRLLFVPVMAVGPTRYPMGLGWACCLRDGWRGGDDPWISLFGRVLVVSAVPVGLALVLAAVLVVVAAGSLLIEVAISLTLLAGVMVVTIGAASAAAVWYESAAMAAPTPVAPPSTRELSGRSEQVE